MGRNVGAALCLAAAGLAGPPGVFTAPAQAAEFINNGLYQAINDPSITNKFTEDVFGGLEVTPYRGGRAGTTVVYRNTGPNVWTQGGVFGPSNPATYTLLPNGHFLWQRGTARIELAPQGNDGASGLPLQGRYVFANDRTSVNVFAMRGNTQVVITPIRSGVSGTPVLYVRMDETTFRSADGPQTYQIMPNGQLLFRSNSPSNVQILLNPAS